MMNMVQIPKTNMTNNNKEKINMKLMMMKINTGLKSQKKNQKN